LLGWHQNLTNRTFSVFDGQHINKARNVKKKFIFSDCGHIRSSSGYFSASKNVESSFLECILNNVTPTERTTGHNTIAPNHPVLLGIRTSMDTTDQT